LSATRFERPATLTMNLKSPVHGVQDPVVDVMDIDLTAATGR
jgi:hypothetical protein